MGRSVIILYLMDNSGDRDIRNFYDLDESTTIGEGSFAKVIKGRDKKTGRTVAIKVIKKQKMNEEEEILLQRQIHIMRNIQHPNIVDFYDYFSDKKYIYLVLEYLSGGQLYDQIAEKVVYTEEEARNVVSPIIDAIRYLHECGIVHRDLKPENCVFSSKLQDRVIKLIDFGVSQIIPDETHLMSSLVGTPLYMAPEILSGKKYNEQVDWWAIGVILYVLLCGYPPFDADNEVELKKEIYEQGIKFDPSDWGEVSEEAQNLVQRLLTIDQGKRITAQEIMGHPWMLGEANTEHLPQVQENIKKFKSKVRVVMNALKVVGLMQTLRMNK